MGTTQVGFYNTTHLRGDDYKKAVIKATRQEEAVMILFKASHTGRARPSQIHQSYIRITHKHGTPITSIRRAMTSLTESGQLIKTDDKAIGPVGSQEHYWIMPTHQSQLHKH